eukprot:gnl/MRDRNA2_/MRDRNA2_67234_c0_seq2.p1 gnl/MRDRNA2_/MRDRNA2_67234_c0~~gnl/MRDRNA2_/MRDRNA2_67234_c0_seq2.p1  ORF type:complete len:586 (-),score=99.60 gnl/MRDRNA2_/MRDRNA2_67234_c0_seq2:82-1794(-)
MTAESDVMKALDSMKAGLSAVLQPFTPAPPQAPDTSAFANVDQPSVAWHDFPAEKIPKPQRATEQTAAPVMTSGDHLGQGTAPGAIMAPAASVAPGMAIPSLSERSIPWPITPQVTSAMANFSERSSVMNVPGFGPPILRHQSGPLDMHLPGAGREQSPPRIVRHPSGPLDTHMGQQSPGRMSLGWVSPGSPRPTPSAPQWPWKPSARAWEISQQSGALRGGSPRQQSFPAAGLQRSRSSGALGPSHTQSFHQSWAMPVAGITHWPTSTSFPATNGGMIQNLQNTTAPLAESTSVSPMAKPVLLPASQTPEPSASPKAKPALLASKQTTESSAVSFNASSTHGGNQDIGNVPAKIHSNGQQDLNGTVPTLLGGSIPTPQRKSAAPRVKSSAASDPGGYKPNRATATSHHSSVGMSTSASHASLSFPEDRVSGWMTPPTAPAGQKMQRYASDAKLHGRSLREGDRTPPAPVTERNPFGGPVLEQELRVRAEEARKSLLDAQRKMQDSKKPPVQSVHSDGRYADWSVAQLKKEMSERGISPMFCFDRKDLLNRLEESDVLMMFNRSRGARAA